MFFYGNRNVGDRFGFEEVLVFGIIIFRISFKFVILNTLYTVSNDSLLAGTT